MLKKGNAFLCLCTVFVVSSSLTATPIYAEETLNEQSEYVEQNELSVEEAETQEKIDTITFSDKQLQTVILSSLNDKGIEEITSETVKTIKQLDARGADIETLEGLQYLTELEKIDLRDNKITDLSALANLSKLKDLNLASNHLEDINALSSLTQLVNIDVRNNAVGDLSPLKELILLEKLVLRGNIIESIMPLAQLTQLRELNLRENAITDLSPLENLTKLVELNLHTNQINDLSPIKNLTNLEYLTMRRNQIEDLSVLAYLTQLKDLNARDNDITTIEALRHHQHLLERLNLRGNPGLTDYSPVQAYYDQIVDVDFILSPPEKNFDDLLLLTGESRLHTLENELLSYNTFIQDSNVRQTKMSLLTANPLAFYRGTAHLFFNDLASGAIKLPLDWQTNDFITWTTGDWHTENIGFYGNNKQEPVFDFNDFDEAAVAPFIYDLLRFATSVYLVNDHAPGLQLSNETVRDELTIFMHAYIEALEDAQQGAINVHDFYYSADRLDGFVGSLA
ncbi:hypothetical protein BleG1_3522 [Shouchella lehensis G1]|uniref:Uncharacterized protein n=1 Tax=Shouchella lehensis G1 TaxID=1246626 RepID=A0A060M7N6_9BACI|nr:hypothetical protein BleG1_3522 [Shouchella lehensis G1]